MTSYIPKYQFDGVMTRRASKPQTIKYRQMLKSGKWGAIREYRILGSYETPEQAFERLARLNPDHEYKFEGC